MAWDTPPAPATRTKVGRNEPCPCGSGKKYKRCCGSKRSADAQRPPDDDRIRRPRGEFRTSRADSRGRPGLRCCCRPGRSS
ncbi:SEC-C metal-binding domain-containing protein [Rhodopseudomonas sp. AAP120]|uniref:SEC-C metal-binding domain-containing protein n=1 Tax=Rhodopseudomonas sp. AAP120 TaxID=1523430 RepID=UPI0009E880CA|nr:SEC-C metal-binding domain-containing protein [Rhodopseudomonas sp. AAP120]